MKLFNEIIRYFKNYRSRHLNNIDLALHIIGVPEAFIGLLILILGKWKLGLLHIFLGYLWQWIGHTFFEKNEMGEITGIKKIISRIKKA